MTLPPQLTLTFDELQRVFPNAFVRCPACPLEPAAKQGRCFLCGGRRCCSRASAAGYLKARGLHVELAADVPGEPDFDDTSRRDTCIVCGFVEDLDDDGRCPTCAQAAA